jgi:uncharacterized damage-inducible protein DinB
MRLQSVVLACCLLVSVDAMRAQTGGAAADPLSGTWIGTMGPSETSQRPITVKLSFDGKAVSGVITGPPQPGDIKTGTFDPKTGALKLGVVVRGDGMTVNFEGTLTQNAVTGRVIFPDESGTFKITKGSGAAAEAPQSDVTAELRRGFDEVSANVTKSAELVPADKYSYRPAASVRTFGQLIGHVADSYHYYCARAAGRDIQWSDAIEKGATDKATLGPKLKQALQACGPAYAGTGKAGALIENIGHTNLHYGNMITYLRMMGLVPPSS